MSPGANALLPHHQPIRTKSYTLQPSSQSLHIKLLPENQWGVRGLWARAICSPSLALQQTFLCCKLRRLGLLGLTVHWAHELAFSNISRWDIWEVTRIIISALIEEVWESSFVPSAMWGYKKPGTQKKTLTGPCRHLNLGLSASWNVRNKCSLFISQKVLGTYI